MGYKRDKKTYKLVFEDDEFDGLVVRTGPVNLGEYFKAVNLEGEPLIEMFASKLVDWNLEEEDGTAVPATLKGIYSQDREFVRDIVRTWFRTIAGVSAPLPQPSEDGEQSQVPTTIPMAPL